MNFSERYAKNWYVPIYLSISTLLCHYYYYHHYYHYLYYLYISLSLSAFLSHYSPHSNHLPYSL